MLKVFYDERDKSIDENRPSFLKVVNDSVKLKTHKYFSHFELCVNQIQSEYFKEDVSLHSCLMHQYVQGYCHDCLRFNSVSLQ